MPPASCLENAIPLKEVIRSAEREMLSSDLRSRFKASHVFMPKVSEEYQYVSYGLGN